MVRRHWHVENGLHWTLDIVFQEDKLLSKEKNGIHNLGLIRRFVMFIIKLLKAYYHRSMKRIRDKIGRNLESEIPDSVHAFILDFLFSYLRIIHGCGNIKPRIQEQTVYRHRELQLPVAKQVSTLPHNTELICDTHKSYYKAHSAFLQSLCVLFRVTDSGS